MDFSQPSPMQGPQGLQQERPATIPGLSTTAPAGERARKGSGWRIFWGVVVSLSILANIGLLLMLVGLIAVFAVGQRHLYNEQVIEDGPASSKIVVISIQGPIYDEQVDGIYKQLKEAQRDRTVKALILRVNSPGGTISGSDGIYQEIRKYRRETGKPVVAFMQGVAASGAYYASVGCDKIVAEPTAITGSIGVAMRYFVFEKLLQDKLGIMPIVMTEGRRKDWPSFYKLPSDEEKDYLRERLLTPAYERFVNVVAEGRGGLLKPDEVKSLADGGVFGAAEALDKKLIDAVGYLDDAVGQAKSLAGIDRARVIEYRRVFSLSSILSSASSNVLKLDKAKLYELITPQILYLWSEY